MIITNKCADCTHNNLCRLSKEYNTRIEELYLKADDDANNFELSFRCRHWQPKIINSLTPKTIE